MSCDFCPKCRKETEQKKEEMYIYILKISISEEKHSRKVDVTIIGPDIEKRKVGLATIPTISVVIPSFISGLASVAEEGASFFMLLKRVPLEIIRSTVLNRITKMQMHLSSNDDFALQLICTEVTHEADKTTYLHFMGSAKPVPIERYFS